MELKELMAAFAAETGAAECAPDEDGTYDLSIDDIGMMIEPVGDGSRCTIYADLGEPPEEGREEVYRALLEASFPQDGVTRATLSIHGGTGRICLHCTESLASVDYAAFRTLLEDFVNAADDWRTKLAAFPGMLAKVKDVVAEAEDESRKMSADGFMRV